MSSPPAREGEATCLLALEEALAAGGLPDLDRCPVDLLDGALQTLVSRHGASAVPLLRSIARQGHPRDVRRTARLALYRLGQAGVEAPPTPGESPTAPLVRFEADRASRAWLSGIDGTGSRALWILFESGRGGGSSLCSLIVNDEAGILEAAGGAITRKRLDAELRSLREHQKLPWVETDPARACSLVGEALALHARVGTAPPAEFSRWRRLFAPAAPAASPGPSDRTADSALLDSSAKLLELPEMSGWFIDPASIHEDALALLQARESRLVVSDQVKAEREAAIIDAVIDKHVTGDARQRWARRLAEMAFIFRATERDEPGRLAEATAAALADEGRPARAIPLVRGLALRGLTLGTEVALGRVKLADVSRAPQRSRRS
jgi:hypothetical protein